MGDREFIRVGPSRTPRVEAEGLVYDVVSSPYVSYAHMGDDGPDPTFIGRTPCPGPCSDDWCFALEDTGYPYCARCQEHHREWPDCPGITSTGEPAEYVWHDPDESV